LADARSVDQLNKKEDLDKILLPFQQIIDSISASKSVRATLTTDLAFFYLRFARRVGDAETLEDSITCFRSALDLLSVDDPLYAEALSNLEAVLMVRFNMTRGQKSLREALTLLDKAPDFPSPPEGLDYSVSLVSIKQGEDSSFIANDSNRSLGTAAATEPEDSAAARSSLLKKLNVRAAVLLEGFEQEQNVELLEDAVWTLEEAERLERPDRHFLLGMTLNNLAVALRAQFLYKRNKRWGEYGKISSSLVRTMNTVSLYPNAIQPPPPLDRAIALHHEAVDLLESDAYNRQSAIRNLAATYLCRYDTRRDKKDLYLAIENLEKVLPSDLESTGAENASALFLLASARERLFFLAAPNEAARKVLLNIYRHILKLRKIGDPNRHLVHHSFARILLEDGPGFDWDAAIEHLKLAVTDGHAPVHECLQAAMKTLKKIERLSARKNTEGYLESFEVMEIYTSVVRMFPRVAHFGQELKDRLKELEGTDILFHNAALRAIHIGEYTKAVELFEEGKAVFWGQALRLKPVDLDGVPQKDLDALTKHLNELQTHPYDPQKHLEPGALRNEATRRQEAYKKAQRLIENIRRTCKPDFLEIAPFRELSKTAENGPIVILVCNDIWAAGLAIVKGDGKNVYEVKRIDLPSDGKDPRLFSLFRQKFHGDESHLTSSWNCIVQPVVQALGLQARPLTP
jgi:tetratricopeptide (TPR) repeat protein